MLHHDRNNLGVLYIVHLNYIYKCVYRFVYVHKVKLLIMQLEKRVKFHIMTLYVF